MRLGIVGHEKAKFTPENERFARGEIRDAIRNYGALAVVSGGCHLGGVDIWAEEEAARVALPVFVYKPRVLQWSVPGGFKDRNLKIARESDLVLVIVVRELPETYTGMRFEKCYHCNERNPPHVKSGGCWTAWKAKSRAWRII